MRLKPQTHLHIQRQNGFKGDAMLPNPIPAPILERRHPNPEEVKERRLYAKHTQQQMADALYVNVRTIQHWELGRSEMPLGLYHLYCLLTIPHRDPFEH